MSKDNKNGFTLIELLVTSSIIVIISTIIIFNIGLERQNSALFRSAQKLSLDLRRAQSFALSSKTYNKNYDGTPCVPSSTTTCVPCGWGVHFNGVNSTSYIIFADLAISRDCSDRDFVRAGSGTEDFEIINLEAGIKVNSLSVSLSDIVFTPPDPVVKFTPDQISATIVLINKNSDTRIINVNKVGLISFQ